jgi:hypothetical protein
VTFLFISFVIDFLCFRINKLQESGLLKHEKARNPLRAEKSPRADFHGWDYTPPAIDDTVKKLENPKKHWNYPESDWGLMAKFSSQKPIYETIYERERNEKQMKEEIEILRNANLRRIEEEIAKRNNAYEKEKEEMSLKNQAFQQLEDQLCFPQKYSHLSSPSNQMQQLKSNGKNGLLRSSFEESVLKELNENKGLNERKEEAAREKRRRRHSNRVVEMNSSNLFNKFGKSSKNQELLDKYLQQAELQQKGHEKDHPSSTSLTSSALSSLNNRTPGSGTYSSFAIAEKEEKDLLNATKRYTKKNLNLYEKNLLSSYKKLEEIPINNIKTLGDSHPELLSQYRTQRAAQFINKLGNAALELPTKHDDLKKIAFRPGGILPAPGKNHSTSSSSMSAQSPSHGNNTSGSNLASLASLPVELLTEQLKKTEDDIAYQKVKIGLNVKQPKRYETTATVR